ncbi:MAG: hypothetical protein IT235_01375 [Bacteroidia bacterium]|nr:hypothetical protein [Bacteroidia bacterium]
MQTLSIQFMRLLAGIFFLSLFVSHSALAQGRTPQQNQHSKEICLVGGMAYYIGDLNQTGHFMYQDPAGGLGFRYNFNQRFAFRLNGWIGKVHAADANSSSAVQRQRNLSFQSLVEEASGQLEFNFLPFMIGSDDFFTPYIFAGMGVFHFNPQAKIGSDTYDLRPLSTEGLGTAARPGTKRYNLTGVTIPFGLGFRWALGRHFGIGVEWGIRKTFTDYIDDVSTTYPDPTALNSAQAISLSDRTLNKDPNISNIGRQRGDSKTTDWYSFTGLVLSFVLPEKHVPCLGVPKR